MGFLGVVVTFERSVVDGARAPECTVDCDGGEVATAGHFGAPGDDAPPLPGDVAYLADDAGAGAAQITGYQDPATAAVAAPGERRIYSRAGPGVVAAELWLKGDGTIVARVGAGGAAVELAPDGSVRAGNAVGQVAVDPTGNVTWTTALGQNGAASHTHATPFGPSGPPIPGT